MPTRLSNGRELTNYELKKIVKGDWISVENYMPDDFDLVRIKLQNGFLRSGWVQNKKWCALNVRKTDKVIFWRFMEKDDL